MLNMKKLLSWLSDNIRISRWCLRITAVVLAATGGLMVYLSRKEPELPLTRVFIPNLQRQITYIWQLLVLAGLLFISAIAVLILSFQKKRPE